jgi:RNA polymerase sigma factor (sigma-70 family)
MADASLPDEQLLRQFAGRRDERAFEVLVRRHAPLVWRVCRRILDHAQDAEDAVQATFLVLARRAAAIRKPASLASWLHGVACRIARRARDAAQRRQFHEREAGREPVADPAREAAWRELGRIVEEELHHLPEKYRLPLLLLGAIVPVAASGNPTVRYPNERRLRRDFVQITLARRFTEADIMELLRAA